MISNKLFYNYNASDSYDKIKNITKIEINN